jgi:hypothetical protein
VSATPKDFCDLVKAMRSHFFAKDRDVTLVTGRTIVLADGTELSGQGDIVPSGIICMWSGAIVDVPSGWSLCDGSGSTPDLTDMFIDGSLGATSAGTHNHGAGTLATDSDSHSHGDGTLGADLGGSHYHALDTGTEVASGSGFDYITAGGAESEHSHTVSGTTASDSHSHDVTGNTGSDGSHQHPVSGTTASGGSGAQENRPAFYALAFIMKD